MLHYLNSSLVVSEHYGEGLHSYYADLTFTPTSKYAEMGGVVVNGDIWFDIYINGSHYEKSSISVNETATKQFPIRISKVVYSISGCNNSTHTPFDIKVDTYFTGTVNLVAGSVDTRYSYSYDEIEYYSCTMTPTSHGSTVGTSLAFDVSMIDYTITAYMTPSYFPGSCVGSNDCVEITVFTADKTQIIATQQYYVSGGVNYGAGFSLTIPDNLDISEIFVLVSGHVYYQELEEFTDFNGAWQGILPYSASEGVKVYTKESNYNNYGILYVKTTDVNGNPVYEKAKSFHKIK